MDFSPANQSATAARPLCHCLGIHAAEIRDSIAADDLSTVRGVTKACGAGGGCTSCHRHIKRMLHEHAALRRQEIDVTAEVVFGFA